MDDSKFLILGANGQLGMALKEKYPNAKTADIDELDITNSDAVKNYDWGSITTVLNAAGYTNVDGAETPEGRITAWKVNARAVQNLAAIAAQKDLVLVHISSDYVFDGTKNPHTENEPLSPLSSYGASKAAGDVAIRFAPKHYLLRTTWLIGDGKNFVRTMLELGQKGISPTIVNDQIGRLSFTTELTKAVDHLLLSHAEFGTYNFSGGGKPASWASITREIFKDAGFNLEVTNTTTKEYFAAKHGVAPRPLNSVFDLSKIEATGFKPRDWREALQKYIQKN